MGYWVGLDVGTTFSAAAVASGDRIEVVGLGRHAAAVPSVLFLREDGTFLVGDAAVRRGLSDPGRVARHFKRRFGDSTPLLLGGSPFSADALVAQMVRFLVGEVTVQEGSPPDGVAVTHPANWGPFKTDLLAQAIRSAGIEHAMLLSEPEAAALQYAWRERVEVGEVVGIYDLGGGTFDAAVLAKSESGFALLGQPEGIERLGGIDFDEAVLAHVQGFLGPVWDGLDVADPATLAALARLRADAVEAKEALSADTDVSIPVMLPQVQTEIRLTRAEFEAMIRPTLAETTAALGRAFRSAGVGADQVKAVLLVGGSSRIPLVGQLVAGEIGRPVAIDVHPKHAVALGAALAAAGWTGKPGSGDVAAGPAADPASAAAAGPTPTPVPAEPAEPEPAIMAGVPEGPVQVVAEAGNTAPAGAPPRPAVPTVRPGKSGRAPGRRRRNLIILLVGLAVVAGGLVAVLLTGSSGKSTPAAEVPTAPTVAATTTTSVVTTGSIQVAGTKAWTDTNIDLDFGQHVTIVATGSISHNTTDPAGTVGPDGDTRLDLRQFNVTVNGAPMAVNHAALIAKIGDGDPFLIGAAHDFDVQARGRLFLGPNDRGVDNNAGAFKVIITVTTA